MGPGLHGLLRQCAQTLVLQLESCFPLCSMSKNLPAWWGVVGCSHRTWNIRADSKYNFVSSSDASAAKPDAYFLLSHLLLTRVKTTARARRVEIQFINVSCFAAGGLGHGCSAWWQDNVPSRLIEVFLAPHGNPHQVHRPAHAKHRHAICQ